MVNTLNVKWKGYINVIIAFLMLFDGTVLNGNIIFVFNVIICVYTKIQVGLSVLEPKTTLVGQRLLATYVIILFPDNYYSVVN